MKVGDSATRSMWWEFDLWLAEGEKTLARVAGYYAVLYT
jgi:hypothetical protein